MTASVTVTGPNQPPSVSITNPPSGGTFSAPWTGVLQATASDTDGSVSKVEFFKDSTSLGSVTSMPYSLTVSNLAAGVYRFTAVATDNLGATNTSAGVNVRRW